MTAGTVLHRTRAALTQWREYEQKQRAAKKQKDALVQVNIRTITKTPTPKSYQVLWEKVSTGPQTPKGDTELMTTTFTVGRIALKTLADAEENRLGLCVQSFDIREHQ